MSDLSLTDATTPMAGPTAVVLPQRARPAAQAPMLSEASLRLHLGDDLSGALRMLMSTGINRGRGISQLNAENDLQAVTAWAHQHRNSPNTYSAYLKEARRLLLWCVVERSKPLSSLVHEDMELYRAFLCDPQPAQRWISATKAPFGDPRWRSFHCVPSSLTVRQSLVIIANLFAWLHAAGHLDSNPMALMKGRVLGLSRSSSPSPVRVARHIPQYLWGDILRSLAGLPDPDETARARWILSVLWFGLRIGELSAARMGDFVQDAGMDKPGGQSAAAPRWWLHVLGKGDKVRWVPVTQELLGELRRYRAHVGLSAEPSPGETHPLVMRQMSAANRALVASGTPLSSISLAERMRPMSRSGMHRAIKRIFDHAASGLEAQGRAQEAELLRRVSAHWVRHTSASSMVNTEGIRMLSTRDTLGHASLTTTNTYLHAERDGLHDEFERLHKLGWSAIDGVLEGSAEVVQLQPLNPSVHHN